MRQRFLPFALPSIGQEEIDEVVDTLKSGWITTGPRTKRFEKEFAEYLGCKHAIAVSSCTAGLHLALAAAGVGPGDEVITTPFTFCSTVNVIVHQGATPVLADINETDLTIDPHEIARKITDRTKAIIPVHYGGQPCRMDEILDLARRHNLLVIEDAAHAVGAKYRDRMVGTVGDVTVFSFYATKNLTTAEGGMIATNDEDLAERMALMSLHGMDRDAWKRYGPEGSWYYEVVLPGYKYNMTDIQAAMGLHQLAKLESFLQTRETYAREYSWMLAQLPGIIIPQAREEVRHAWHLYPIQIGTTELDTTREQFMADLAEQGIGTSVHFIPVHLHPWYRMRYGYAAGDFPVCEKVYSRLISLPLYPAMTMEDVRDVVEAVTRAVEKSWH